MPGWVLAALLASPSWHAGCPVPLGDLREVPIQFADFHNRPALGKLVVHKDVAREVAEIFSDLFQHRFQIERMEPIDTFDGNDDRSMAADNTSAFNCRDITGQPGKFSNHSWGRAIDINPLINPYVKGDAVFPPEGRLFLDRSQAYTGGIAAGSYIVRLFERHGWAWGGNWKDRKDYQHFEKPIA
jgi:D-alanyl-D-alanine carboxypeptidase